MSKATSKFSDAKFCPFCGVEALERDRYGETMVIPRYKLEFSCRACGKGVQLIPSLRYQFASQMATEHRQMRPPDRPVKPKPEDEPLHLLMKYHEAVGMPGTVRRSKSRPSMFVFEDEHGKARGSTNWTGAKLLLRGWQLAVTHEKAQGYS